MTRATRRRDRHGRGMRGPLTPRELPISAVRTTAYRFDELVRDAIDRLEGRWSAELDQVEFAVEDVPSPAPSAAAVEELEESGVPLSRLLPAAAHRPARIVLFRRPLELRAPHPEDLADLVHEVVVEQFARLLGLDPDQVDPPDGD